MTFNRQDEGYSYRQTSPFQGTKADGDVLEKKQEIAAYAYM